MQCAPAAANFPELVRFRVPAGLPKALALAARVRNTSASEYARQAILRGLEADGVCLRDGRIITNDKEDGDRGHSA